MTNKIKTAIASFGMSGQVFHGPLLKVNPGFDVVQIHERSKNNSAFLFPETDIVRSYDEVLRNPEVELVVVNTPDAYHYEMVKQALIAGKHVVVEKPATQKSDQTKELMGLAKDKGVVFTVFQNRRWDGDFMTVRKVLEHGNLGRLVEYEAHYDRYRPVIACGTWKEEGDDFVGVLHNLGSHMVDQTMLLFGKPLAVTAHLKVVRTNGKVVDYYDIRLEYANFSALLKSTYLAKNPGPRYTISGELGTFHKWGIDPQEELLKAGHLPVGEYWGKEPHGDWGILVYEKDGVNYEGKVETIPGNYNAFYDNVYDVIRNDAELEVKPEQTYEVLKVLEACLQSNREKRTITL